MTTETLNIKVDRLYRLEPFNEIPAQVVRGFVDIVVSDCLLIRGIKIIQGQKGLFVSMPKEQGKDGKFFDLIVPMTREAKQEIESIILEAYSAK